MSGRTTRIEIEALDEARLRELVPSLLHTIELLKAEIADLRRSRFGRSSEKGRYLDGTGLLPFAEIDELIEEAKQNATTAETVEIPAHTRKRTARRSDFPEHLPRRRTECTIDVELRACPDCGTARAEIGESTSQELERIELTYVHVIARKKYACRQCEGHVVLAPGPERVLDKCLLGAHFLAQIIFERFGNHMPYARLEKKYKAEGLDLARSVMCTSTMRCAELLEPVYVAVQNEVLSSLETSVLQVDDSEVVERDGPNAGRRKVHIWAWRDQHAGVFYTASAGRGRDYPALMLGERSGRLQCDGHDSFTGLDADRIVRIGCWSHIRRYFEKACKSGDRNGDPVMEWIGKLFAIERAVRQGRDGRALTDDEVLAIRRERSAPVVDAIKAWLEHARLQPPSLPGGPLMKGVTYGHNQWQTLTRFLHDGRIREISNNGCERALRSLVIGRNNWQWFGSESGTKAALVLMTLVQSCREHRINPLLYLADVLREVSTTPASKVGDLTPTGWRRRQRAEAKARESRSAIADVVRALTFNG